MAYPRSPKSPKVDVFGFFGKIWQFWVSMLILKSWPKICCSVPDNRAWQWPGVHQNEAEPMNLRSIHVTAFLGGALLFQCALPQRMGGAEAGPAPKMAQAGVLETPVQTAGRLMAEHWLAVMRSWFQGGPQFVRVDREPAQPLAENNYPPAPWTLRPICGPVAFAHHLLPLLPGTGSGSQPSRSTG